jgi:hypothetical protein
MRRYAFQLALGGLALTVAIVGFLVGFLRALDDAPRQGATATEASPQQGGATFFGTVESIGDKVVVATADDKRYIFDSANLTVIATDPGSLEQLKPGDILIFAVERNQYGDQAIRYIIRVPQEAQARATP